MESSESVDNMDYDKNINEPVEEVSLDDSQSIVDDYNDIMAQPPVQFNIIEDSKTARQNDVIINLMSWLRIRIWTILNSTEIYTFRSFIFFI